LIRVAVTGNLRNP